MNNAENWLTKEQQERAKSCICNIKDKLGAIESELLNEHAYKNYILEKIDSVCWDSNCIKNMCKEAGND